MMSSKRPWGLEEENDMIIRYTTKAWQDRLTRRLVTHTSDPHNGLASLILTTQEEQLDSVDWEEATCVALDFHP